jgi:hypothetical protein
MTVRKAFAHMSQPENSWTEASRRYTTSDGHEGDEHASLTTAPSMPALYSRTSPFRRRLRFTVTRGAKPRRVAAVLSTPKGITPSGVTRPQRQSA